MALSKKNIVASQISVQPLHICLKLNKQENILIIDNEAVLICEKRISKIVIAFEKKHFLIITYEQNVLRAIKRIIYF